MPARPPAKGYTQTAMAACRPPLHRLLAHVLLAVALLLQATTTLAMAAGHRVDAPGAGDAATAKPAVTPHCHGAGVAPTSDLAANRSPVVADCCGSADQGLCAWACSLVVAAPVAAPLRLTPVQPSTRPEPAVAVLRSRTLPVPLEPPRVA